jgi:DNase/tRNase domain of colicin-like bacteriocin
MRGAGFKSPCALSIRKLAIQRTLFQFDRVQITTCVSNSFEFSGKREKDNALADKVAGITEEKRQDEKYTWHHHQDGKTMQLIKRDVHKDFFHTGGMAGTHKEIEECNSTE